MFKRQDKKIIIQSSTDGIIQDARNGSADRLGEGQAETSGAGLADAAADSGIVHPAMMNENPLKRRIANPGRRGIVAGLFRFIRRRVKREHTAEELAAMKEAEYRKQLYKVLQAEAKIAGARMIEALTRLGICYENKKSGGVFTDRFVKVRFSRVLMEPNALWFKVSPRLPYGTSYMQLMDEKVTYDLSMSVGKHVVAHYSEPAGFWFMVERAAGKFGIPNHVNLVDMWNAIPESKDRLTIPVGVAQNGRMIFESLSDMIHCMVAGTSGGGKSNFIHVMLTTLIRRNRPDQLKMVLVDLKGGMEFGFYEGTPHLIPVPDVTNSGIVNDREFVPDLFNWLIHEGERRMVLLRESKAQNIAQYNAHRKKNRLPRFVVVIDEWSDVMLSGAGKRSETLLMNIVQRMRAVGIHVILSTQTPTKQVISLPVRANLPAKFAFPCANQHASIAILGNAMAHNLAPVGRCIVQSTILGQIQIQTPFIPLPMVIETVTGAQTGNFTTKSASHDVTPDEVWVWAIRENYGWLSVDMLYKQFRARGLTVDELRGWLAELEAEENHVIDSTIYRVQQSAGNRPRRLVASEEGDNE